MKPLHPADLLIRVLIPLLLALLLRVAPMPLSASQALAQAGSAVRLGQYARAAGNVAQAASIYTWRPQLWELAGQYALTGGDSQAAITYLNQADALGVLSPQGRVDLGDAYSQAGDTLQALANWQAALSSASDPAAVHRRVLEVHLAAQDYPAAAAAYKALLAASPGDAQAIYQLGLILAAISPLEATSYLEQAAALDPTYSQPGLGLVRRINTARLSDEPAYVYLLAGRELASLNEWELAFEAFHQATRLRPDYAEAWAFLGEARQHLKSPADPPQQALLDLERGLALNPQSLAANSFLAIYWQRQGRYDLALPHLQTAVEIEPHNPTWLLEIANTTAMNGDVVAAFELFYQAIDQDPDRAASWQALAEFSLQHQVRVREIGLPAARMAVTLDPDDPRGLDLLGHSFILLQDYASAERFLLRALMADPHFAPAHLHLGINYLLQGDSSSAYRQIELARSLAPEGGVAQQAARLMERYFPDGP